VGIAAQWFPEYGLDLGPPLDPLPASIDALRTPAGVYVRRFAGGLAIVNPDDAPHAYAFDGTRRLVEPHGGGPLPADADVSAWGLNARAVAGSLTLAPHSGAFLLT
jgi:hypothetical protein